VDSRRRIGDKLCTGIVGHECTRRFPLDRSLIFRDAQQARIVSPKGEAVTLGGREVQAHVVDRVAYVASFSDRAREAGASYLLGYRATEVSLGSDGAAVQVAGDDEVRTLRGRALVLATGFGSELAGRLQLGRVGDFVTGVQAEVLAPSVDEIHVYFGQGVAPGFFAWLVPTSKGKALVGLLSRRRGLEHLANLVLRLQVEGKVEGMTRPPAKWGVPLRPLKRTFGERLVVVGDAAGQLKPTTGGGIYYALLASEVAAEALDWAFRRGDLSGGQLSSYEREWKALLSRELEVGYSARRLFELLKDCQIDFLVHAIASNGVHQELADLDSLSFDWHSDVIARLMGHPMLGKALSFINPMLATLASHS
jgi:flavin-dependent dehydrogenase